MNARARDLRNSTRTPGPDAEFAFLDRDDFREHYADPEHPHRVFFYVEGVHCTSCLFRIENLKDEIDGIRELRLDMGRHILTVETAPSLPVSAVAARLKSMGYTPRPVAHADLARERTGSTQKSQLLRIGVAGACAGNIMLLSTSRYAGATHTEWGATFEWIELLLFLPILLFAAVPFYKNTIAALRSRRSSIDVPIAAAVVIGTVVGAYHLVVGSGDIYFDSLSVLVFLLLSARYLLYSLQSRFLAPNHLSAFYETNKVRVRKDDGSEELRHISGVRRGDLVVVYNGERIPVDGALVSGEVFVNAAVLTGEAQPQRVLRDQTAFAGTQLMSDEAVVSVEAAGKDTRVGKLLEETERGVLNRTPLISLTDRVAQWFSASVLALGVVFAVVYATIDLAEAIDRALALVILACPCALALATPLTQSLALKKAARKGCLIKNAEAFEKLSRVGEVFFDKTGTLTKGELEMRGWWPAPPDDIERSIIFALERGSMHPIARVISASVSRGALETIELQDAGEIPGRGVVGVYDGDRYELRSLRSGDEVDVAAAGEAFALGYSFAAFYKNGELVKVASLGDTVRESSRDVVAAFESKGRRVHLLTGDAHSPATAVARAVGIDPARVLYGRSPEEKREVLAGSPRALMVGDGVNDSVALANAYVSVAVQGSMETSFKAADIYLTQPGLTPLVDLYELSFTTISIIKRNLAFSLVYNSVFGTLALLGYVNPLVAAILMPASSVTVVVSSVAGNAFWRAFDRHAPTKPRGSHGLEEARKPATAVPAGGRGAA
jgi:Cu2+-exporting ATPase/Cu+-exporting ATPase